MPLRGGSFDDSFIQNLFETDDVSNNYCSLERQRSHKGRRQKQDNDVLTLLPLVPSKYGSKRSSIYDALDNAPLCSSDSASKESTPEPSRLHIYESGTEDERERGASDVLQQEPPLPTPKLVVSKQMCVFQFEDLANAESSGYDNRPLSINNNCITIESPHGYDHKKSLSFNGSEIVGMRPLSQGDNNMYDSVRTLSFDENGCDSAFIDMRRSSESDSKRSSSPSASEASSGYSSRHPDLFSSPVSRRSVSPSMSVVSGRSVLSQEGGQYDHQSGQSRHHRPSREKERKKSIVPKIDNIRAVRPYVKVSVGLPPDGQSHREDGAVVKEKLPYRREKSESRITLQHQAKETGDQSQDVQIKRYPRYRRVNSSGETDYKQRPRRTVLRSAPQTPQVLHKLIPTDDATFNIV